MKLSSRIPENAPDSRPTFHITEDKYPKARAIPVAFWISYFTLHWLTILEVVERTVAISGTTVFFLVAAVLSTVLVAGFEATNDK